jgi:MFS family permease
MSSGTTEATKWSELSAHQKKSGLAAWLGWFFDGLDLHLYTLVWTVFVAELLLVNDPDHADVGRYGSYIQAACLLGWARGGAFFGIVGDRIGRSRTLVFTILTYALFTGLSFFAHTWWQLMIFRFLAALGIGGEWAIGASLLSETWPKRWRPWIAAVLQCAVNFGILAAIAAVFLLQQFKGYEPRWVFLIGVLPAFVTLWIRKEVPETAEWSAEKGKRPATSLGDLFGPDIRRTTTIAASLCAISLAGHWCFMFWQAAFIGSHPEVLTMVAGHTPPEVKVLKFDFDPANPRLGSIELDWNPEFVEMLKTHGYIGNSPEEIVDQWLMDVCRTISSEVPYMDNVRYIQRRNLGDGKTEFS